jgi:hypothetical protein
MPKDPKRNIQSYQIEGGHLNEFEFQKRQGEMTEEAELPFAGKANKPKPAERVTEVTAKAHRKVAKRKSRGIAGPGGKALIRKGPVKKTTRTAVKNKPAPPRAKKPAPVRRKKRSR